MDVNTIIQALIIAALLGVGGMLLKVSKELIEWRVILFGPSPEYKNGMRGDIRQLREDVDGLLGLDRRQYTRRASDIS